MKIKKKEKKEVKIERNNNEKCGSNSQGNLYQSTRHLQILLNEGTIQ